MTPIATTSPPSLDVPALACFFWPVAYCSPFAPGLACRAHARRHADPALPSEPTALVTVGNVATPILERQRQGHRRLAEVRLRLESTAAVGHRLASRPGRHRLYVHAVPGRHGMTAKPSPPPTWRFRLTAKKIHPRGRNTLRHRRRYRHARMTTLRAAAPDQTTRASTWYARPSPPKHLSSLPSSTAPTR